MTLIEPAAVRILEFEVQPPTARARADLVRATVLVVNKGREDHRSGSGVWNPRRRPGGAVGVGAGTRAGGRSAGSASYDPQTRAVTPVVTLKGLGGHGLFGSRGPERFNATFTIYAICPQQSAPPRPGHRLRIAQVQP